MEKCSICHNTGLKLTGQIPYTYCGSAGKEQKYFQLYKCGFCGSYLADIKFATIKKHFEIAGSTDLRNFEFKLKTRKKFYGYIYKNFIQKYPPEKSRIIDFGSAFGNFSNFLYEKGYDMTGIELNTATLDYSRKKYPDINFVNKITDIADHNYDAFIALDSMYYVHDLDDFFKEAYKRIMPGGYFIFRVTNRIWYTRLKSLTLKDNIFSDSPLGDALYAFSEKGLKCLFERNGFKNLKLSYIEKKTHSDLLKKLALDSVAIVNTLLKGRFVSSGILGIAQKPLENL